MENQPEMGQTPPQITNDIFNQQKLPNATTVLVLGIVSLVMMCCCSLIGLITSIVGIVLANKDKKLYLENPNAYLDYNNLNTGRILCIIGLVISIISLIVSIIFQIINFSNPGFLERLIYELNDNLY